MSDEINSEAVAESTEAEPATQESQSQQQERPQERTYTKAELDAIIKGKLAEQRRKLERAAVTEPTKPQPAPKAEQHSDVAQEALARIEAMERRAAFAEALTLYPNAHKLNATQRKALSALFDPAEPDALASMAEELYGNLAEPPKPPAAAAPATPPAAPAAPTAPAAPAFDPGAPAGAPREPALDPSKWSSADIAVMRAQGTFREQLERWRAALPGGAPLFRKPVPKG